LTASVSAKLQKISKAAEKKFRTLLQKKPEHSFPEAFSVQGHAVKVNRVTSQPTVVYCLQIHEADGRLLGMIWPQL
jgi:CRISPR/Cas system endoribonuclease Cas6 (RAMP superfamily)